MTGQGKAQVTDGCVKYNSSVTWKHLSESDIVWYISKLSSLVLLKRNYVCR